MSRGKRHRKAAANRKRVRRAFRVIESVLEFERTRVAIVILNTAAGTASSLVCPACGDTSGPFALRKGELVCESCAGSLCLIDAVLKEVGNA
jgi:hypothetical protein